MQDYHVGIIMFSCWRITMQLLLIHFICSCKKKTI